MLESLAEPTLGFAGLCFHPGAYSSVLAWRSMGSSVFSEYFALMAERSKWLCAVFEALLWLLVREERFQDSCIASCICGEDTAAGT